MMAMGRRGAADFMPDMRYTVPLVKRRIRDAVALHIRGMREDSERVPRPTTVVDQVDVVDAA
jgi:hypothetical protein